MKLAAVILAAGKGTRMKSKLPKVLHTLCGQSMLSWVINAVTAAGVEQTVVVVGHGAEQVAREVEGRVRVALQAEQLGTAHALLQAGPHLKDFRGQLLVLCGDTPLIEADTLSLLVQNHRSSGAAATVLTTEMEDPSGYGRVIRNDRGGVCKIVEHKDATPEEKKIREVNTGIYCFEVDGLFDALGRIAPVNTQGEYYLTDVIEMYAGGLPSPSREQQGVIPAAQALLTPAVTITVTRLSRRVRRIQPASPTLAPVISPAQSPLSAPPYSWKPASRKKAISASGRASL
jgi:bifunctional UDP-N-acetylglucosamine pyrophosphorylase/glucosamine-1-phosphate N-acetyltransferase